MKQYTANIKKVRTVFSYHSGGHFSVKIIFPSIVYPIIMNDKTVSDPHIFTVEVPILLKHPWYPAKRALPAMLTHGRPFWQDTLVLRSLSFYCNGRRVCCMGKCLASWFALELFLWFSGMCLCANLRVFLTWRWLTSENSESQFLLPFSSISLSS